MSNYVLQCEDNMNEHIVLWFGTLQPYNVKCDTNKNFINTSHNFKALLHFFPKRNLYK